ncbi:MAG: ATP-dependent Clp protease ATP-binding subunit [Candidatus Magasanikbacteria bacterium]|jgi:ATP-dependent Clp protease ATP-binding subunit ClpC|nr:ATP-dependent Clp protease ATP-binding subunit [Candidatus Magasanikbacteria bacterium]MBT5262547.1 ATP-dependent Clp protease ATP-binding subunit [Candidatus Magasanikbacteria bacterium]MBT5820534.1 ATP-dependent Clp protease ATP-binding subunit [Candidatus Magasanikbacteria bacterium]MBT6294343.1 ATP-dependent Clp protease ATP-binding subunit [Candidatus Magasanikbacteria bacterium]
MDSIQSLLQPPNVYYIIGALLLFALYQFITVKKPSMLASSLFSKLKTGGGGTPILNSFTVDFTELAKLGKIDPVIGREKEIIRLAQILSRKRKNNAVLVGAPGVGKTAIAEGIAVQIAKGNVPETIQGKRVLSLNVANLLSGTKYRGEFEERAKKLVEEIKSTDRTVILFIDELHSVIQSQGTEGAVNFGDILKPALARGELQLIGATTTDEYAKYITTDPALERRFQPVEIKAPTQKETYEILKGIKEKYECHHRVQFTDEALKKAITLTHQKIKKRTLPDKAIDAIDEAASLVRVSHINQAVQLVLCDAVIKKHPDIQQIWEKIQIIDQQISHATNPPEKQLLIEQREQQEDVLAQKGLLSVDVSDIEAVVSEWST